MVLGFLEEKKFVADAFADEDAAGVLLDNGFLVLDSQVSYCSHLQATFGCAIKERKKQTYLENGLFDLFRLSRLGVGFVADIAEFGLVADDSSFQLGNVVLGVLVSSIKHVSYADEGVSLAFEVFQDTFFPASCFVFEELFTRIEVPCCSA